MQEMNGNNNQVVAESLLDWMKSETFSYDFSSTNTYEGETYTATGSMAMQGDNYAIASKTSEGESRIIYKDGITYVIEETSKIIMTMPSGQETGMGIPTDYGEMTKLSNGTGIINGKTLQYEEYQEGEYKMKIYMENGNVYGIESEGEGAKAVMIITNAKKTVPVGTFDIPTSGYTKY